MNPLVARLLGFGAVAAPPHVFALDARVLRYGRFVPSGGGWELRELRRAELPADAFQSGVLGGPLRDPAAFGGLVEKLLGGLSAPVPEASLVLPDLWQRLTFIESGDLPRAPEAQEEVVRWKVRRMLPFRVEELRLAWSEVAALPQQSEPRRLLIAYALESLLQQLEAAFAAHGVWIGRIVSESLALLPAVGEPLQQAKLGALAVVHDAGYTLLFARRGEPVLYRFKALDDSLSPSQRIAAIERDLRLTRAFVGEQLPELPLERAVVVAPTEVARSWQDWLEAGLGRAGESLEALKLPLASAERVTWIEVAPLLGAVRQEVS